MARSRAGAALPAEGTVTAASLRRSARRTDEPALFCFPHAGGSATSYARWVNAIPGTTVVPVELPGRGERIREHPLNSMDALITELVGRLLPMLSGQFALFGHSMGALVAFEFAHRVRRQYGLQPTRLLVSGCRPPGWARRNARLRHLMPDGELWEEVRKLNGTPDAVHRNEEIRRLCTAAVRADFTLVESYSFEPRPVLTCPISVFGGSDDPEVAATDLMGWSAHTSNKCTLSVFSGDHFFLHHQPQAFIDALARELGNRQTGLTGEPRSGMPSR